MMNIHSVFFILGLLLMSQLTLQGCRCSSGNVVNPQTEINRSVAALRRAAYQEGKEGIKQAIDRLRQSLEDYNKTADQDGFKTVCLNKGSTDDICNNLQKNIHLTEDEKSELKTEIKKFSPQDD